MNKMQPMKESVRIRIQYYGGRLASLVFGFSVRDSNRVPRTGGLIIACNHISDLDPPVLGFAIPRTVAYMAKKELFGNRFGDFFLRKLNAFPVDRSGPDTMAVRTAIRFLKQGDAVVIFPEGTRSRDGRMLSVKAGISLIAMVSGAPVIPAFIWGTDHPASCIGNRSAEFNVCFGKIISNSELRRVKKKDGNRAVARYIAEAIASAGIEAGLYPYGSGAARRKEECV